MSASLKPHKKYEHLFAIVRYDSAADPLCPIDFRVTVKKIVADATYAASEVKRLNELNQDKGSYYFYQITRFEDVPVETQSIAAPEHLVSRGPTEGEEYSQERKAEFLLNTAVNECDYQTARAEVVKLGLDPDSIPHSHPPASR